MCLITFQIDRHPSFKLVLAANRDEAYDRLTRPAGFWPEFPLLLAGKDLEAGGTWMGITKKGKIAALTNCHQQNAEEGEYTYSAFSQKQSRGKIVRDYLAGDASPLDYLKKLQSEREQYEPFNIILGTADLLYHFNSLEDTHTLLAAGMHSVSNATLDTPWPKVVQTKQEMANILQSSADYREELFKMMSDETPAPDESLPLSPLSLELKRKASANFIVTDTFGTRSTTLLLIDHENKVTFQERTYLSPNRYEDRTFQFYLEKI